MKKAIFFSFILLLSQLVFAQHDTSVRIGTIMWFSPFGLMDIYQGPNISIAHEIDLNARNAWYSEIQINRYGTFLLNDRFWGNLHGFTIKQEHRKFMSVRSGYNPGSWQRTYIGLELSAGTQEYTRTDTVVIEPHPYYLKTYRNQRKFIGLAANIGYEIFSPNGWMFGYGIGFGLRYNQVKNDLTDHEAFGRQLGSDLDGANWIQKKGDHIIPKFNFFFRIGYRWG
ncbi:MAG: hypothetical protein GC181_14140 [Bacteroidetes bacterium]|nr:hypothetical protein [Bacteroidota bacterium]